MQFKVVLDEISRRAFGREVSEAEKAKSVIEKLWELVCLIEVGLAYTLAVFGLQAHQILTTLGAMLHIGSTSVDNEILEAITSKVSLLLEFFLQGSEDIQRLLIHSIVFIERLVDISGVVLGSNNTLRVIFAIIDRDSILLLLITALISISPLICLLLPVGIVSRELIINQSKVESFFLASSGVGYLDYVLTYLRFGLHILRRILLQLQKLLGSQLLLSLLFDLAGDGNEFRRL